MKINRKSAIGILVGLVLLFFAVRQVELSDIKAALAQVRVAWVVLMVAVMLFNLWLRAVRWQYMIKRTKKVPLYNMFKVVMIGFMANNVLPARLGEIVRAYMLAKKEGVKTSYSLATIVLERIIDSFAILFIMGLGYLLLQGLSLPLPGQAQQGGIVLIVLLAVVTAVLLGIRFRKDLLFRLIDFFTARFFKRFQVRLKDMLTSFINGLDLIRTRKDMIVIILYSLAVWLTVVFSLECAIRAMNITTVPVYTSFVVTLVIIIGVMIPSAPAFVGTIQYCCVLGLGWFGVPKGTAISLSLVYHVGQFIPVTALGLYYYWAEQLKFSDITKNKEMVSYGSPENQ